MTIHLRTWGDLACFTRPEMKVERVSLYCKMAFRGAAPFGVTVSTFTTETRRHRGALPGYPVTPYLSYPA